MSHWPVVDGTGDAVYDVVVDGVVVAAVAVDDGTVADDVGEVAFEAKWPAAVVDEARLTHWTTLSYAARRSWWRHF